MTVGILVVRVHDLPLSTLLHFPEEVGGGLDVEEVLTPKKVTTITGSMALTEGGGMRVGEMTTEYTEVKEDHGEEGVSIFYSVKFQNKSV